MALAAWWGQAAGKLKPETKWRLKVDFQYIVKMQRM
jgi:hypothetical protein